MLLEVLEGGWWGFQQEPGGGHWVMQVWLDWKLRGVMQVHRTRGHLIWINPRGWIFLCFPQTPLALARCFESCPDIWFSETEPKPGFMVAHWPGRNQITELLILKSLRQHQAWISLTLLGAGVCAPLPFQECTLLVRFAKSTDSSLGLWYLPSRLTLFKACVAPH